VGSAEANERNTVNSGIVAVEKYEDTLYHAVLCSVELEMPDFFCYIACLVKCWQ